jgi:hypothetical protein
MQRFDFKNLCLFHTHTTAVSDRERGGGVQIEEAEAAPAEADQRDEETRGEHSKKDAKKAYF